MKDKSEFPEFGPRVVKTKIRAGGPGDGATVLAYLTARFTYRDEAAWRARLAAGELRRNGIPAAGAERLEPGDELEYRPGDIAEPPVDFNFRVVYADSALLVIDKPGNLPVHPAGPWFRNTLWRKLGETYGRIHFPGRLDRETSGLLAALRTPEAIRRYAGPLEKEYRARVRGRFAAPVDATGFLFRDMVSPIRKKRRFAFELPPGTDGERAATRLEPVQIGDEFSEVAAFPETGRLHQIRATLWSLGFPVCGDKLYGPDETLYLRQKDENFSAADRALLDGRDHQALQSHRLRLRHPVSGEILEFVSGFPL